MLAVAIAVAGLALAAASALENIDTGARTDAVQLPYTQSDDVYRPAMGWGACRHVRFANGAQMLFVSNPAFTQAHVTLTVGTGTRDDDANVRGLHDLFYQIVRTRITARQHIFSGALVDGDRFVHAARDHLRFSVSAAPDKASSALDVILWALYATYYSADELRVAIDVMYSMFNASGKHAADVAQAVDAFFISHSKLLVDADSSPVIDLRLRSDIPMFLLELQTLRLSPGSVTAVVFAPQPLDDMVRLASMVVSTRMPNNLGLTLAPSTPALHADFVNGNRIVLVDLLQDSHLLHVSWLLTANQATLLNWSHRYVGRLFERIGPGSLNDALLDSGYVSSMQFYTKPCHNDVVFMVSLNIHLTSAGAPHYLTVLGMVIEYLRFLNEQELPQYVWDEMVTQANVDVEHRAESAIADIANGMRHSHSSHIIYEVCHPIAFNPAEIKDLLQQMMTQQRMRVTFVSKTNKFKKQFKYHPQYHRKYAILSTPVDSLVFWTTDRVIPFALPQANPFALRASCFPWTDFDMETPAPAHGTLGPRLIFGGPDRRVALWHNEHSGDSKARLRLRINSDQSRTDPAFGIKAVIWLAMLRELLREPLEHARQAGCEITIGNDDLLADIELFGYARVLCDIARVVALTAEFIPFAFAGENGWSRLQKVANQMFDKMDALMNRPPKVVAAMHAFADLSDAAYGIDEFLIAQSELKALFAQRPLARIASAIQLQHEEDEVRNDRELDSSSSRVTPSRKRQCFVPITSPILEDIQEEMRTFGSKLLPTSSIVALYDSPVDTEGRESPFLVLYNVWAKSFGMSPLDQIEGGLNVPLRVAPGRPLTCVHSRMGMHARSVSIVIQLGGAEDDQVYMEAYGLTLVSLLQKKFYSHISTHYMAADQASIVFHVAHGVPLVILTAAFELDPVFISNALEQSLSVAIQSLDNLPEHIVAKINYQSTDSLSFLTMWSDIQSVSYSADRRERTEKHIRECTRASIVSFAHQHLVMASDTSRWYAAHVWNDALTSKSSIYDAYRAGGRRLVFFSHAEFKAALMSQAERK